MYANCRVATHSAEGVAKGGHVLGLYLFRSQRGYLGQPFEPGQPLRARELHEKTHGHAMHVTFLTNKLS